MNETMAIIWDSIFTKIHHLMVNTETEIKMLNTIMDSMRSMIIRMMSRTHIWMERKGTGKNENFDSLSGKKFIFLILIFIINKFVDNVYLFSPLLMRRNKKPFQSLIFEKAIFCESVRGFFNLLCVIHAIHITSIYFRACTTHTNKISPIPNKSLRFLTVYITR